MDAKSQRREESLKFNIDQLNKSLAEGGDDLLFELCIDTHQHSQSMEAYVSQSDLGLIVEIRNLHPAGDELVPRILAAGEAPSPVARRL